MEIFQLYSRISEDKAVLMHNITGILEKVWRALRVTHAFVKEKFMNEEESRN